MSARARGELALVLHSHMPYVEGFDTWPFGEEWLWEAVACVYLPLLEVLDGAPVTLGLTPVLCDQLEALDGDAGERYLSFLRETRAEVHVEDAAGLDRGDEPELAAEVRRAAADYREAERLFCEPQRGALVRRLAELERRGPLELWTSAATHSVLPLLATDAGLRVQVGTGVRSHERRFGSFGGGFWLPECAYTPGLERELAEFGVGAFCVDQTEALGLGSLDQLEPIATQAGPVAVPIDWELISLVWDGQGFPAHGEYRNYWGRTTHDLRPWSNAGEPYRHWRALVVARGHAREFVRRVAERLDAYRAERGRPGLVCCALDTELLGHWWYEGRAWLSFVLDEARLQGVPLATLPDALSRHEPVERPIAPSTWGRPKDLTTWDSPRVADIAFAARAAELRTVARAAETRSHGPALERAVRELLALQSSDWAFQVTHDLAGDYPHRRVAGHTHGLDAALDALTDSGAAVEAPVRNLAPRVETAALFAT
ncbi:MAG TPA: 1,4-alpha-glucan branching protein domain-containing protein [Thermoleophilaceae bacterium]|nr:1,4-alpha-glucan branching protein domain-containing protein [Thermoleophilaceae bacterium]